MTAPGHWAPAQAAAGCSDLAALARTVAGCRICPELAAGRTRVVVGTPWAGASLMLVGEAPGAEEDAAGVPFVGRAGRLLDALLAAAGLARADVAVANVLKCRPPGNRAPRPAEVAACRGWLDRQVALVDPDLVVTLGGTAAAWAFGRGHRLADLRGRPLTLPDGRPAMATYHPSAALRFGPAGQPRVLLAADLAAAARWLAGDRPGTGRDGPVAAPDDAPDDATDPAADA